MDTSEDWDRLFADTQAALSNYARRRLPPADAADAVAETYARAWAASSRYRALPDAPVIAWLFGILRNVVREQCRSSRDTPAGLVFDEARQHHCDDPGTVLVAAEDAARVRTALDRLSDGDRAVVVLRVVEGRASSEVARLVGRSSAAVRMAQTRALRRMGPLLRDPATGTVPVAGLSLRSLGELRFARHSVEIAGAAHLRCRACPPAVPRSRTGG